MFLISIHQLNILLLLVICNVLLHIVPSKLPPICVKENA